MKGKIITMYSEIQQRIAELGIKVGSFITYKDEICSILKVDYSSQPHTKKKHMKDVQQFMKLEPVGKGKGLKYEVVEIYDSVQERDDKRKLNGHFEKFNEILGEKRHVQERTIPIDLLHNIYSFIHLTEYAKKQCNMTLYDFIHSTAFSLIDVDEDYLVEMSTEDLFRQLGLCNGYSQQIMLNKVDLEYKHIDLLVGHDVEIVRIVMNNLYGSMRSKILCDCAKKDKVIVCNDNLTYVATQFNKEDIAEVEEQLVMKYNDTHNKKLTKYGDIYNKLTNKERMSIQRERRELLSNEINDYSFDRNSIFINKTIKSDIECLIDNLGDLYEVSEKMLNEFYEQLKHDVFSAFYDNEVERINKHYEPRLDELRQCRHFGSHKLIESVERDKCVALKLLDLCVRQDLTSKDVQIILQMIE